MKRLLAIHGGASGGPVFDARGRVCDLNSIGFAGCPDISFISRIHGLFPLTITDIKLSEAAPPGEVSIQWAATAIPCAASPSSTLT
jgi:hypothetical protein